MSDDLDDLLALAEEEEANCSQEGESFLTCNENMTINRTVDETFFTTATHVTRDLDDFSDDDEDRSTPTFARLSNSPEERRLTLTEQETKDLASGVTSPPLVRRALPLNIPVQEASSSNKSESVADQLGSDGESDNEDLYEKKSLNESGKSIQKLLKEGAPKERISLNQRAEPVAKPAAPSLGIKKFVEQKPTVEAFDKFFGFKIKNPRVSSMAFDALVDGVKKQKLMTLRQAMKMDDGWVTMGVIVEKADLKKSASGHEYLIWKVHDLKNCQDKGVKLLLFGESCKEHWKLQVGATIALVSPQFADQQPGNSKDSGVTLKVSKKLQVIDLGFCSSFGTCKGVCHSGQKCSNFVNTDASDYCVFHIMSEARKVSSKRGVFNSVGSVPAKRRSVMPTQPAGLMMNRPLCRSNTIAPRIPMNESGTLKTAAGTAFKPSEQKTTTKEEEKTQLQQIMGERSALLGAKNLERHAALKNKGPEEKEVKQRHASMANFIQEREEVKKQAAISRAPSLGFGLRGAGTINLGGGHTKSKDAEHEAARLRAIAILKRKKEEAASGRPATSGKGLKRPAGDDGACGTPSKQRRQLGAITNKEELEQLLKRKSLHENEANKEELSAEQRYFGSMEHKEKVESFATSCMVMKNIKVITCKKCGYTAQKQSEYCMQQGHLTQKHSAEKRFFKCGKCKKRTVAFGMMPTKPCEHCDATEWERVAMKDERRVVLDNEKLELRGEERSNVNV